LINILNFLFFTTSSPKQVADALGHSLDTHLLSYARFMSKDLESAFDAANKPKEKITA